MKTETEIKARAVAVRDYIDSRGGKGTENAQYELEVLRWVLSQSRRLPQINPKGGLAASCYRCGKVGTAARGIGEADTELVQLGYATRYSKRGAFRCKDKAACDKRKREGGVCV